MMDKTKVDKILNFKIENWEENVNYNCEVTCIEPYENQ